MDKKRFSLSPQKRQSTQITFYQNEITSMIVSIVSIPAPLFCRDMECRTMHILSSSFHPEETTLFDFASDVLCGKDDLHLAAV